MRPRVIFLKVKNPKRYNVTPRVPGVNFDPRQGKWVIISFLVDWTYSAKGWLGQNWPREPLWMTILGTLGIKYQFYIKKKMDLRILGLCTVDFWHLGIGTPPTRALRMLRIQVTFGLLIQNFRAVLTCYNSYLLTLATLRACSSTTSYPKGWWAVVD